MVLPCATVRSDPLACKVFIYHSNIVALDLVGAVIPILVSMISIAVLIYQGKDVFNLWRALVYSVIPFFIGLVVAGLYQIYDSFNGGITSNLAAPAALPVFGAIVPAAILQAVFLERKNLKAVDPTNVKVILPPIQRALMKSYVIGTFGIILSDIFRIFGIPGFIVALNVSPEIIGAYQYEDGVFQDGLFLALFCLLSIIFIYVCSKSLKLPRDLSSHHRVT